MKKTILVSLLALGLAGCNKYSQEELQQFSNKKTFELTCEQFLALNDNNMIDDAKFKRRYKHTIMFMQANRPRYLGEEEKAKLGLKPYEDLSFDSEKISDSVYLQMKEFAVGECEKNVDKGYDKSKYYEATLAYLFS